MNSRAGDQRISVGVAARRIGVSAASVRRYCRDGQLQFIRINSRGDRRISVASVEHFIAVGREA